MKLVRIIKNYLFGRSSKEIEMNRILEKISNRKTLSSKEKYFLELYQSTTDDDFRDYVYLSKNSTFHKITQLLEKGNKVICDLHDKDGKIGLQIISVENQFETEKCKLIFKNGTFHFLHDKFLYNLIYNIKKNEYSLQEQDEYFEKITTSDDDQN